MALDQKYKTKINYQYTKCKLMNEIYSPEYICASKLIGSRNQMSFLTQVP